MMGYHKPPDDPLFSSVGNKGPQLRQIKKTIDFDFLYKEVEPAYGTSGNVSAPPRALQCPSTDPDASMRHRENAPL